MIEKQQQNKFYHCVRQDKNNYMVYSQWYEIESTGRSRPTGDSHISYPVATIRFVGINHKLCILITYYFATIEGKRGALGGCFEFSVLCAFVYEASLLTSSYVLMFIYCLFLPYIYHFVEMGKIGSGVGEGGAPPTLGFRTTTS